jgi:hypothetical protein
VTNGTDHVIYIAPEVDGCGPSTFFFLSDANGRELNYLEYCTFTCQQMLEDGIGGCPAICLAPEAIRLEPGEVREDSWNGQYLLPTNLADACDPEGFEQCVQRRVADEGPYTITVRASDAITCDNGFGDCETCMGEDGDCRVQWATSAGTWYEVSGSASPYEDAILSLTITEADAQ